MIALIVIDVLIVLDVMIVADVLIVLIAKAVTVAADVLIVIFALIALTVIIVRDKWAKSISQYYPFRLMLTGLLREAFAPRVGAWIETSIVSIHANLLLVAPRAGA